MTRYGIPQAVVLILAGTLVVIVYKQADKIAQVTSTSEKLAAKTLQQLQLSKPLPQMAMSKEVANVPAEILQEMLELNEKKVSHDNPRLVSLIREYFIHPPSKEPYNLAEPDRVDYASQGKDNIVPEALKYIPEKSFFVECGAFNGESFSHSLYFEKTKHWSGLLVEANVNVFKTLLQKHRKAYSVNACLSSNPYPTLMTFNQQEAIGRLVEGTFKEAYTHHHGFNLKENMAKLQCFPLYSMLLALDQVHVDLFGLDIEGMELPILRTIPWDKVNITHILAEFTHSKGGLPSYKTYFEQNGYKFIKSIGEDILVQRK